MRMMTLSVVAVISVSCGGCEEAAPLPSGLDLAISVEADPGVYLSGVPIRVDGNPVGRSDSNGILLVNLRGSPGRLMRFEHDCPDGHRAPARPEELRLRRYEHGELTSPIEVSLTCRPEARLAVFVVRAINGPNLPVSLDGEVAARTNGVGVAHFSKLAPPGTEFLVRLDAEEFPSLLPQNASHLVALSDSDEIFVIDQAFEGGKKRAAARAARRRIIKIE